MEEKLQQLLAACQQWRKLYSQLEDKAAYQPKHSGYYQLEKVCLQYFEDKKHVASIDLQNVRQAHHQWQATFDKGQFLGEGQNPAVVADAYQSLKTLDQQMENLDWSLLEVTTQEQDQQWHQEVKAWQEDCQTWLQKHAKHLLLQTEAKELAQGFSTVVADLQSLTQSLNIA